MIEVKGDYKIETDPLNYIAFVEENSVNKKTKEVARKPKLIGYYPNAFKVLEAVRDYKVRKCIGKGVKSLEKSISEVKRLDEEFIERLKEVLNE